MVNISQYTQKPRWERRLPISSQWGGGASTHNGNIPQSFRFDNYPRMLLSQGDFENEKQPSAHVIYDVAYRSNRPQFRYDEKQGKNVVVGYEKVERVSIPFQQSILRHKVTHAFGNPVWLGNEGESSETPLVNKVKSYWNSTGMNSAMLEWGRACFGTGDGALLIYLDEERELRYKVLSYEKGDIITQFYNPEDGGRRNVIRMYREHDIDIVEIYGSVTVKTWVKSSGNENEIQKWWGRATGTRTDDDYVLVKNVSHGLNQCPVVYHREPDVCWGAVQGNIEDVEKLLSDLLENGKYYNFQMLFVTGLVGSLPSINFQGKVIAARNKDADAKILAPADASNTFTLSLEQSLRVICDGVGAVFIQPGELKGGDYSGAYLRNLYFPETQWCVEAYARMDEPIREIIRTFKQFVGLKEDSIGSYKALRISYVLTPYIPSNLQEEAQIINSSFAAGTLSRQTATEELPVAASDETQRLDEDVERATKAEEAKAEKERQAQLAAAQAQTGGGGNDDGQPQRFDKRFKNQ